VRLLAGVLLALLALGPASAVALAAEPSDSGGWTVDTPIERYLGLIEGIRGQLAETRDLYAGGDVEAALRAARSAYLDSFELVEIPLRARDPNMTLEMEDAFARLRNDIRAGRPAGAVTDDVSRLLTGLNEVERTLSLQGLAPIVVAGSAFTIVLRTGLEALVVLVAVLGFLAASRATRHRRTVLAGAGGAVAASLATWFVLDAVLAWAPIRPALVQAIPGLLAVAMTIGFSYWLLSRLDQRRWLEFMSARVFSAVALGSGGALFSLGFATVYRQGFEAVVYFRTLRDYATGAEGWLAVGILAAAGALVLLTLALARLGRRVPVQALIAVAVVVMMAVSVAFLGNAVRALQEGYMIGITNLTAVVPRLPIHLAQATGFHPTLETIGAQVALGAAYVIGAAWLLRGRSQPRVALEQASP
jgi:high-affinity iron transporter